jgi:hypothetical protein
MLIQNCFFEKLLKQTLDRFFIEENSWEAKLSEWDPPTPPHSSPLDERRSILAHVLTLDWSQPTHPAVAALIFCSIN